MSTAPTLNEIQNAIKRASTGRNIQAYLFGSRATGTNRFNSDWDIAITSDSTISGCELEAIRESLEALPTLHSFDVIDFNTVSDDFKKIALTNCKKLI